MDSGNPLHCSLTLPKSSPEYLKITFNPDQTIPDTSIQNGYSFPLAVSPVIYLPLKNATLISERTDKCIIEIVLDCKKVNQNYFPGDTIGIIPSNNSSEVEEIANILGIYDKLDVVCEVSVANRDINEKDLNTVAPHLPKISTLRNILENCVEIRGAPRKIFLRTLAEYTSDPIEKETLLKLCSKGGNYYEKEFSPILEGKPGPGFGLLNFLKTYPSCIPPVSVLLQHLPRLKPRPYSIASSPLASKRIRILFSVYRKKEYKGVCTGWLESFLTSISSTELEDNLKSLNLNENQPLIPMFFRKSVGYRLPDDLSRPLVLIGPGTGLAPFIGFLQHVAALKRSQDKNSFGDIWLFYGCQSPDVDFIAKDELKTYLEDGVLTELFLSFSRYSGTYDGWNGAKYVQDNIKTLGNKFVDQLLKKEAVLYISGDAKNLYKGVMDVVNGAIQEYEGMDQSAAAKVIKDLIRNKRYLQDIWY